MGRGRTWRRQIPWLRRYGRVFTFDAAFHTGADAALISDPAEVSTERFVADLAEILTWIDLGPAVLVGHSMGALHAWCAAAEYPELVSALVVEDMAPDFRGRTTAEWTPWFDSWPDRFSSLGHAADVRRRRGTVFLRGIRRRRVARSARNLGRDRAGVG